MTFHTPRDVLALGPNPAAIPIADIARALGISKHMAGPLRTLATRAPSVLEAQWQAVTNRNDRNAVRPEGTAL